MKIHQLKLKGQSFFLHPIKAIFWKENSALILSDLHIGKAAHFRKNGIPISERIHDLDYQRITYLIETYNPSKIIIVGDLFHSTINNEWQAFISFVKLKSQITFYLIKGNHDILSDDNYTESLQCFDRLELGPFCFIHEPKQIDSGLYLISGHIHPSVSIKAKGRQKLRIPCFYFTDKYAVLPSFGNFTGNYKISFKFGDLVYLIVDDQVVPYNPTFYHN